MDTYIYLLITMAFSAFFSGMEIAFFSVDKLRFEMERKADSSGQRPATPPYWFDSGWRRNQRLKYKVGYGILLWKAKVVEADE